MKFLKKTMVKILQYIFRSSRSLAYERPTIQFLANVKH